MSWHGYSPRSPRSERDPLPNPEAHLNSRTDLSILQACHHAGPIAPAVRSSHCERPPTTAWLRNCPIRISFAHKTRAGEPPTHFAAVADERGSAIGLVHAYERPALEKAYEVVVQSLVVDQKARQAGIGKQLMSAAEAWAKSRGVRQVVLQTRVDRDDARSFYEHVGYRLAATSHLMVKTLDGF